MSIFDTPDNVGPTAEELGKGFLIEANQSFDKMVEDVYDAVQRFWFRGDGEPTGPEILIAMGTDAAGLMTSSYIRVQMLLAIQDARGKTGLIDMSRVEAPYDLKWNADGTLDTATLKE